MKFLKKTFSYELITLSLAFTLSLSACSKSTEILAVTGNAEAQYEMGLSYMDDEDNPQDAHKGVELLHKSAEQGYAPSQDILGYMYSYGRGVRQDESKAIEWTQKAADQGYAEAQYMIGLSYSNNPYGGYTGFPQSDSLAKEWFGKACDNGYQDGCDSYRDLN